MASENRTTDQILHLLRFFIFLVLLLQMKPREAAHAASDRIVLGASLMGRETRISKNGSFELGFFNLTNNDVTNWYVGIWYATNSDSQQTIAWVANREQPLKDESGVFNLTEAGSLILSHGGSVVWSSMGNKKKPSSVVMMDSGNLVVQSAENSSEIIWQSFDHPGNTWLPVMQISMSQRLTSWKNDWDPRPGPFSFQMDPSGVNQLVLLWKNDYKYWESGILHDNMFSKLVGPESVKVDDYGYSNNSNSDFTLFSNGSYKYFTYSTPNDPGRIVMDKSGQIRVYSLLDSNNGWNMVDSQPDSVQVPDDPHSYKKTHSYKKATVAGVVGGLAAILAFVLLFLWCRKRPGLSATEYAPGTLTVFTYRDLQRATKNFSERLGGGGFGVWEAGVSVPSSKGLYQTDLLWRSRCWRG